MSKELRRDMTYREMVTELESSKSSEPAVLTSFQYRLLHAIMGLSSESGEMMTTIKAHLMYNKSLDKVNLIEELGDIRWFYELACIVLNVTDEDVRLVNFNKLYARYGSKGFSKESAISRDLGKERKAMVTGHSNDDAENE